MSLMAFDMSSELAFHGSTPYLLQIGTYHLLIPVPRWSMNIFRRNWQMEILLDLCHHLGWVVASTSIKLYLSAVHHMQVVLGFPEPRAESSLPRLRLESNGIARSHISALERNQVKPRLPITIDVLQRVFNVLASQQISDRLVDLLWAICSVCFFGFFRVDELLAPSVNLFWLGEMSQLIVSTIPAS